METNTMFGNGNGSVKDVLSTLSRLGKSGATSYVQSMLIPHVIEIFSEYDHTVVKNMIRSDYDLVRKQTPEGVKNALQNMGSDPQFRKQFEGLFMQMVTPENILDWLENPEEWLDAEDAEEQREELQKCATVIRETPGGRNWLERQVLELYRLGNIIPEDSTPAKADD